LICQTVGVAHEYELPCASYRCQLKRLFTIFFSHGASGTTLYKKW
jgi:hypothetical protein